MQLSGEYQRGPFFHIRHNGRLVITAFALALCTFTFGYDALVIGNVLAIPAFIAQFAHHGGTTMPALTATEISILVAVPISGAAVGAWIVAFVGDKYGRKKTLFLGCLLGVGGAVLQTAAPMIAVFTIGRFISYASTFILLAISVAFQNEVAPPVIRGVLGALGIVSVNLGGMVSAGVSFGTWKLTSSAAYRVPIGLQILWPFIIAAGIAFTMESPTTFLIRGDDARATVSLKKVRQGYSEQEIAAEMASLRAQQSLREAEKEVPWTYLFRGPNLRRTLLAAYIGNVQVLTGLFYSTSYATIFLTQIGSADPFLLVFGLSILSLGGAVAGLLVVDWMGRRTLALVGAAVIFVIDLVIGVTGCLNLTDPVIGKTLAAFFLLFGFFFAAGFGPLVYINPAEMPTARLRNKTSALTFFIQNCNSIVCLFVFPYITNADAGNLGAKVYLLFAGCMLVHFVIVYFIFPELKGRTPAEVDEMFEAHVPARKFKGYVCAVAPEHVETMNLNELKAAATEEMETVENIA